MILTAAKPSARVKREALALAGEDDRLAFGTRELFWLPSGGIRDSRFNAQAADELLGPTTTRTMGTIETMTAKFFASDG